MPLWLADQSLVLASKSAARRAVLAAAGIPFDVVVADIDERGIEAKAGDSGPETVAQRLAVEKAKAVAAKMPGRIVIGADQTLALGTRRFSKPNGRDAARTQLAALRGQTHMLCSGIAAVRDGGTMFEQCAVARMTMRDFSDEFLDAYLDTAGNAVSSSVGGYQLETLGVHLFERIEGDHFTILGMPLLPLLAFLRRARVLSD